MFRRLLFHNFRFFFLFSQQLRQRFTASGMMIVVVMFTAGVFGLDTRATLSFQIFSVALILLLVAMTHALFFRGKFTVTRQLPDYATVGQPLQYTCLITNNNNKARKQLLVIDDLKGEFPNYSDFSRARDPLDKKRNRVDRFLGYPRLVNTLRQLRGGNIAPASVEHVAEKSDVPVKLRLLPLRRGYLHFEKIRLASADPMGLFHAQKIYPASSKLLVLPRLYNTPKLDLPGHRVYQAGGSNKASLTGDSQEFVSLRDYRPGDPLRSIHWRSYAKRGEPIVKEYQDEYFVRYGLILDTFLNSHTSQEQFEQAVSVAASFMAGQTDQDTLMDLMFIGNQAYRYTAGRSHHNINAILEILACIEPTHESNTPHLQNLLQEHAHECCGLVCVLLAHDEERLALLRFLQTFNMPVKALIVTDDKSRPINERFEQTDIHLLDIHSMQADLDALIDSAKTA